MKENFVNNAEIPLGLGMALAQNLTALDRFARLSAEQKKQIISQTHQIHSHQEMVEFAQEIADGKLG